MLYHLHIPRQQPLPTIVRSASHPTCLSCVFVVKRTTCIRQSPPQKCCHHIASRLCVALHLPTFSRLSPPTNHKHRFIQHFSKILRPFEVVYRFPLERGSPLDDINRPLLEWCIPPGACSPHFPPLLSGASRDHVAPIMFAATLLLFQIGAFPPLESWAIRQHQ